MRVYPRTSIRGICAALMGAAVAVVFPPWAAPDIQGSVELYVATTGRDDWSGTLREPNPQGTDGPLATPAGARDALRRMKAKSNGQLPGPVTVSVRGGKYYLQETLVLGPEDSGTRAYPVTYSAYPGEQPILSGGRKLEGWRPFKDHVFLCEIPDARASAWRFRQLFYNGKRQTRARYPNCDPGNPLYSGWLPVEGPGEPESYVCFK